MQTIILWKDCHFLKIFYLYIYVYIYVMVSVLTKNQIKVDIEGIVDECVS